MNRRGLLGVLIAAALVLLTACANDTNGRGMDEPSPSIVGQVISLVRTGGFAGVNDKVVIAADGAWSATDRAGARKTGHLSEQQRSTLDHLAYDPGLVRESARAQRPSRCVDAYSYVLTVGAVRVSFVDCPTDADLPPTTVTIVRLLTQAVWG